uniref:Uncharacterized protein n=1 Tax=Anguilla anguilla TaxID=7936 RepID=A0A0E9RCH5_ANGAN
MYQFREGKQVPRHKHASQMHNIQMETKPIINSETGRTTAV